MKFHDLNTDRVSFVYDLYEVSNVEIKHFVEKLLRNRIFIIAKSIP